MKKITPIVMTLVLAFVMSSCSKEKRISRAMTKKDGVWDMDSYKVSSSEDGAPTGTFDFVAFGASGNFTFEKDNDLTFELTFMGSTQTSKGTWANTSDKLTMNLDGDVLVFDIEDRSKKEIKLKTIDTYTENGVVYQDIIEIELSR